VAFVLSYVMQIEGKRAAMNAMWRANAAPIKPHDRAPDSKWLTHLPCLWGALWTREHTED
jgi:hypothetical protein